MVLVAAVLIRRKAAKRRVAELRKRPTEEQKRKMEEPQATLKRLKPTLGVKCVAVGEEKGGGLRVVKVDPPLVISHCLDHLLLTESMRRIETLARDCSCPRVPRA